MRGSLSNMRFKISVANMNRYAAIGSPCLHPRLMSMGFDKLPHYKTKALTLLLKSVIHLINW